MALPLEPPIKPALARSAKELPEGEEWHYEPKWDGFRTIVFKDGGSIHLQSRGGKPMNRYFPDVVEQTERMGIERAVVDGEMLVIIDGVQEFDMLSQRIHPAESRVTKLAAEFPARFVAFDVLAVGDEDLMDRPYSERRERLEALDLGPDVELTPSVKTTEEAGQWLQGNSEGVIAKRAESPYVPGDRKGMAKIKRVRTADCVVAAFRFGKEPDTVGSLILGLHDDQGELRVVGHTSGFKAKEKRDLLELLEPYRTGESGPGEPSRWKSDEELAWQGLRPELVVEIAFDHTTGDRIRHGTKLLRWREDKSPAECSMDQLRN